MSRLQTLDGQTWQELWNAPVALLMLGKTDCPACHEWTAELESHLADDDVAPGVRFGKLVLDTPGLGSFKKAHPEILKDATNLPLNLLLVDGEVRKQWFGKGWERFANRLARVTGE